MFDFRSELPVMEHFYTIQGEGFHSGRPAYFIRLAGCRVGCHWCDVKESWNEKAHPRMSVDEIVENVRKTNANFCVITGGEPAMHNLNELIDQLKAHHIYTAIETSGTSLLLGDIDWYCFSPKKFKEPLDEAYERASELKVIIYHKSDFEWAESHAKLVKPNCRLYLQPEWSRREQFLPKIIKYAKQNPKWNISLQTHKWMDIP